MDELDLLLDDLASDSSEPGVEVAPAYEDDAMVALEEFQSASTPKDRLEALKLLIHLSGK